MKHIRALTYVIEHELKIKAKLEKEVDTFEMIMSSDLLSKNIQREKYESVKEELAIHSNRISYMKEMLDEYLEITTGCTKSTPK